jgi:hypothetical protein
MQFRVARILLPEIQFCSVLNICGPNTTAGERICVREPDPAAFQAVDIKNI